MRSLARSTILSLLVFIIASGCGPGGGGGGGSTGVTATTVTTGTGGAPGGAGGASTAGTGGVAGSTTPSGETGGVTDTTTSSSGTGGVTGTTSVTGGTGGVTGTTSVTGGTGGVTETTTPSGGTGGVTGTTSASGGSGGVTGTTTSASGGSGGVTGTTSSTTTTAAGGAGGSTVTVPVCGAGQIACGAVCVDPLSDPLNCAGCGNTCPFGTTCDFGTCTPLCQPGYGYCGGACANLQNDAMNCGACGATCAAGEPCESGVCGLVCPGGQILCNNTCVDPLTSAQHCGGCNLHCPLYNNCAGGTCTLNCSAGQALCNGVCTTLQTDPASCGACGNACAVGLSCVNGSCGCPAGEVLCGGTCVDPNNDPSHCGASGACQGAAAGAVCAAGEVCADGACSATCPAGKTACGNTCVDLSGTNAHCGACNVACPNGAGCIEGSCVQAGPLHLLDWSSAGVHTIDRTTGQLTYLNKALGVSVSSFTYDRKNARHYIANQGVADVTQQDFSGPLLFYWFGYLRHIAHDPTQDVFYVAGYAGNTYGLRKWSPPGALLGTLTLPEPEIDALTVDPQHHKLYVLAGTSLYVHDIASGAWSLVANTGVDWGDSANSGYKSSLAYDPSSGMLYLTHWPNMMFGPEVIAPSFQRMNPKTGATVHLSTPQTAGPIALMLSGDGTQCFPLGGPCSNFVTCGPYEVCVSPAQPWDSEFCVPVLSCPSYCGSCACLGAACNPGTCSFSYGQINCQ